MRQNQPQSVVTQVSQQSWVSPLPPPDVLEAYRGVDPKFLDTVVDQIKAEAEHRRSQDREILAQRAREIEIQNAIVTANSNETFRNQIFGFLLCLIVIGMSGYLAILGQSLAACASFAAAIAWLFWGKRSKDEK